MTNTDFINRIVEFYKIARSLKVETNGYNIWRGVNHSVSSESEDLFAFYMAELLEDKSLEFIVDKTMSITINGNAKSTQFRPDLAILKNNVMTHIFDLKMDMGYKRRYHETDNFVSKKLLFDALRSGNFNSLKYDETLITVSPKIINQVVVISESNSGAQKNIDDIKEFVSGVNWMEIYYLASKEVHPNNPLIGSLKEIQINQNEFDRLKEDTFKLLQP